MKTQNKQKEPGATGAKRRNVFFKHPAIYDALCMAVELGIIPARSASERVSQLVASDVRRVAAKLRGKNVKLPEGLFEK